MPGLCPPEGQIGGSLLHGAQGLKAQREFGKDQGGFDRLWISTGIWLAMPRHNWP